MMIPKVSTEQERDFERANVEGKRAGYLKSNPVERFASDPVYFAKVQQLEMALSGSDGEFPSGWVLDLGGNTGGESTILAQHGIKMVVSDINEVALEIACKRAEKFELIVPKVVAADVHKLPFSSDIFQVVMVIEALHHFENYDKSLAEILRVLEPGGRFLALEPIGWNPFRRLSEIRDRFRGTIEKSFTRGQLFRLLREAGFDEIKIEPVPCGRSAGRMLDVPSYRRPVARFHSWLQQNHPKYFGAYLIRAKKAEADGIKKNKNAKWPEFLRTPGGEHELARVNDEWVGGMRRFPHLNGVPVLIEASSKGGLPDANRVSALIKGDETSPL